jgi:hypothetical protein
VLNCDVTEEVSSPPLAERTPDGPGGTLTVTVVDGGKGVVGTKIREWPCALQVPGTLGVILGFGDPADMSPEKVTTTGSAPSTPVASLAGEIAARWIGPAARAAVPDPEWPGWTSGDWVTANTAPAVIAAAAAVPSAISRTLGPCGLLPAAGGSLPEPGG